MKNLKIGIIIMLICTFFTATGQLFLKYGSVNFGWSITGILNYNLLWGLILYATGAVLVVVALKFGDLSTLYPFISLTFVWVMFISMWFLGEKMNNFKIGAVIFIIFGVVLIARGSNGK